MTEVSNAAIEELKRRIRSKGSQKAVAAELEISPAYLNDILMGKRNLSDNVLEKLGYEKVTVHVKVNSVPDIVRAIETAQEESAQSSPHQPKKRSVGRRELAGSYPTR